MNSVLVFLVHASLCGQPPQSDDLAPLIREATRQARHQIKSISARYEIRQYRYQLPSKKEIEVDQNRPMQFEWNQEGEVIKFTQKLWQTRNEKNNATKSTEKATALDYLKISDSLIKNDEQLTLHRHQDGSKTDAPNRAVISLHKPGDLILGDLWQAALFTMPTNPSVSPAELIQHKDAGKGISRDSVNRDLYCIVTSAPHPMSGYELTIVVDPKRNYLVKSVSIRDPTGKDKVRLERLVVAFKEHAPGIFFPTEVQSKTYEHIGATEQLVSASKTVFTSVVINRAAPPSEFALQIPPDTPVADLRDNTQYILRHDGTKKSVQPLPSSEPIPVEPTYRQSKGSFPAVATAVVVVCAIMAIGLWLYARRRKRLQPKTPESLP